ncbi:MAG: hypothetical protein M3474_05885 [Actinomycetota bacterium]|nr:hypothetical protein [Actinomycetota bacterium]
MTRSTRSAVGAATAALAVTLTGCSTGFGAQTTEVYNAAAGTDIRGGEVEVLSGAIVIDGDGAGTLSGGLVGPQNSADALTSVQVTDGEGAPVEVEIRRGSVPIPAGELVLMAEDAEIAIAADTLAAGMLADVAFTFQEGGPVSGALVVMAQEGTYEDVEIPKPPALP